MDFRTPRVLQSHEWDQDFTWLCQRLRFLIDNASDNILGVRVNGKLVFPDLIDIGGLERKSLMEIQPICSAVISNEIYKKITTEAFKNWIDDRAKYPADHPFWKGKGEG